MRLGISARQSVGAISRSAGALLSAELAGNCLAMRGRRFVVTDLDLDGNFVVSGSEFALFIYNNLEPIICVVIALLCIVIPASRVRAGDECATKWLVVERDATSAAGLLLFCNLLNMAKSMQSSGRFVVAIYQIFIYDMVLQIIVCQYACFELIDDRMMLREAWHC